MVNYADDLVIVSRGQAEAALSWFRWAMTKLGLTVNEQKTCVRNAKEESFDFLGYTFGPEHHRRDGHWYLSAKPSKKSIQRLKSKLRAHLRRGNMQPWERVRDRLNAMLRGWAAYFAYGTRYMAYRAVDNYVYELTRHFLCKRHKVPSHGPRRFSRERVHGELGVQLMRTLHLGPPACASA